MVVVSMGVIVFSYTCPRMELLIAGLVWVLCRKMDYPNAKFDISSKPCTHKFCLDALLTATYINNRLPTSTLNFWTPFDTLVGSFPDYSFMRVFGCHCHPLHIPSRANKLIPRFSLCVFIGYATAMKEYRCLDIKIGSVLTSCHVVFNETSFPFVFTPTNSTTSTDNQGQ